MTVPVVTAVTDPVWEADFVRACESGTLGVTVVRRCVELADLLAAAGAGLARAALLSGDLRRLDRDALARLAVAGVAVVGVVPDGDEDAERRLRRLGVASVVTGPPEAAAGAVKDVVAAVAGAPARPPVDISAADADPPPRAGRVVAVWGPTGAPGRTTLAVNLTAELAGLGTATVLLDADGYGGCVAQVLGVVDDAPGLAAAVRLANTARLDLPALAELARTVAPNLRLLSGLSRPDRWKELRPSGFEAVLELTRLLADVVVVDCGFGLADERDAVTVAALGAADEVVAVGSADPVGLARLVRALGEVEAVAARTPRVVANRVRTTALGAGDPLREVTEALARYAAVADVTGVPLDVPAYDAALARGVTLAEAAPRSAARLAIRGLAASLAGVDDGARRGRRWGRRAR